MRLDKDRIKEELTLQDVELILRDLGSAASIENSKGELMYTTVCHSGSKHKLYYYPDSYTFHCYTDCKESFDIYGLVAKVKKISFPDAIRYVSNLTGKTFTTETKKHSNLIDDWKWIEKIKPKNKIDVKLTTYDETVLQVFLPYPHEAWLKEISYETLQKYKIGYYVRTDQITIPCYDLENNLIGIRVRNLREEEVEAGRKYVPAMVGNKMYNFPTMYYLYGLNQNIEAIKRLRKVAIFEGEKSPMICQDFYGNDNFSVATLGSHVSNWQVKTLLDLGVEEVFYCPDKEFEDPDSVEAYTYAENIKKVAKKFTPFVRFYVLWDQWGLLEKKDSPVDKGKEVLEELMRRKIELGTTGGE